MMYVISTRTIVRTLVLFIVVCSVKDACSSDFPSSSEVQSTKAPRLHPRNRFQEPIYGSPRLNFSSKSHNYTVKGNLKLRSYPTDTVKNNSLIHRDIMRNGIASGRIENISHLSQSHGANPRQISPLQPRKFTLRTNNVFVSPGIRSSRLSRLHTNFLKPYVKYPSPFPEDNSFQTYSGSSRQSENRLHALLNNSYPYPVSSDSHFDNYPYQRHPFNAKEDAQEEDSPNMEFPGLFGAPPIQYSSLSGPSFVLDSKEDYYAVAGTTAILTCTIRNLHNYTVSWVRGRDIRLLTTGLITYTSDKRFVPSNPARGQDWLLKIHYSRKQDAGAYLCQVSLSPPITKTLYLHVHEAEVHIVPGKEVHVQVGSTLHLECHVRGCTYPVPGWRHEGRPLPPSEIGGFLIEEIHQAAATNFTHEGKNVSTESKVLTLSVKDSEDKKNKVEKRSSLGVDEPKLGQLAGLRSVKRIIKRSLTGTDAKNGTVETEEVSTSPQTLDPHSVEEMVPLNKKFLSENFGDRLINLTGFEIQTATAAVRRRKSVALKDNENNNDEVERGASTQNLPDGPIGGAGIELFISTAAPEAPPYTTIVTVTRKDVTPQHSGIYTCTSTCTPPINVTVHVLRGEELAAIHHQNGGGNTNPSLTAATAALTALCVSILLTGTEHKPLHCRHKLAQTTKQYKLTTHQKLTPVQQLKKTQLSKLSTKSSLRPMKRECMQELTTTKSSSDSVFQNKEDEIRQVHSQKNRSERRRQRPMLHDFFCLKSALFWWHKYISVAREQSKLHLQIIQGEETFKVRMFALSSTSVQKKDSSKTFRLNTFRFNKNEARTQIRLHFVQHRNVRRNFPEEAQKSKKCIANAEKYYSCLKCSRHQVLASATSKYGGNFVVDATTYSSDFHELPSTMDDQRTTVVSPKSPGAYDKPKQVPCFLNLIYETGMHLQLVEKFVGTYEDHKELSHVSNGKKSYYSPHAKLPCILFSERGVFNWTCRCKLDRQMWSANFQLCFLKLSRTIAHSKPFIIEKIFIKRDSGFFRCHSYDEPVKSAKKYRTITSQKL